MIETIAHRWNPGLVTYANRRNWEVEEGRKLYHKPCDAYLPDDGAFCPLCSAPAPLLGLDFGNDGWTVGETGAYCGDRERAIDFAVSYSGFSREQATAEAHEVDTRPSVQTIFEEIRKFERRCCGQTDATDRYSVGPWDEYFSLSDSGNRHAPLSSFWRIVTFVVRGGSEGIYLHVGTLNDGKLTNLLIGKTCREDHEAWMEAHESAARIGYFLS